MVKRKVEYALNSIADTIFSWDCVDSVVLMETDLDEFDPYFQISMDVYYRGQIPCEALRLPAFSYAGAFESDSGRLKDRFLVEDIPFRVEYKSLERFDELISGKPDIRDNFSYALFRIQNGRPLHARSTWIQDAKLRLVTLSEGFWLNLRTLQEQRLQHCLADLTSAALREDDMYFQISLGLFVECLLGVIFTINGEFQPAPRFMSARLGYLEHLPEAFAAQLAALLNRDGFSLPRTAELAAKITQKVLAL